MNRLKTDLFALLVLIGAVLTPTKVHAQIGPFPCGGDSGLSTYRPEVSYSTGQSVISYGVTYWSLVNNNQGYLPCTSTSNWTNVSPSGSTSTPNPLNTVAIEDKGGQVNNVLAYGAVTGTTDNTVAFNAAVAACPSSTCTVYVPPGTYAFKSTGFAINQPHVTLQCAPGATLQAQTGFPTGFANMLNIQGSSSSVAVTGCTWDGNAIAEVAIQVLGAASNVTIDGNEFKGQTADGIIGGSRTSGPLKVTNNYFHNLGASGKGFYDQAGVGGFPSAYFDHNWCDTITQECAGAAGLAFWEASYNKMTNVNVAEGALYTFGADNVDWQHNYCENDGVCIHADTPGGGNISWNTALNDTAAMADFFAEAAANVTMEGNKTTGDVQSSGILVGSGSSTVGPVQYRTQLLSFNSTTGVTAGTGVTLSIDTSDHQTGTGSMVATPTTSFPLGAIWYYNFSAATTFFGGYQEIWIKPNTGGSGVIAGWLQLVCSINTNISTSDLVMPIPTLTSNTWRRLVVYVPGWQGSSQQNSGSTGYKSCGVVTTLVGISTTLKFDDLDNAVEVIGDKVINNTAISTAFSGVQLGGAQNAVVSGNYVENTLNTSNYTFTNSPGTMFSSNVSNFGTGYTGTTDLTTGDTAAQSTTQVANFSANGATTYATPADILGPVSAAFSGPPAITGCGTISAQTGSNYAGAFATTTAGTCAAHLAEPAAPHGWNCNVQDVTQHTALTQSATSTTSCTVTGTTVASDVLTFSATPY